MNDNKDLIAVNRTIKRNLIRLGKLFSGTDTSKIAEKAGVSTETVRLCLKKGKDNKKVVEAAIEVMKEKVAERKVYNENILSAIKMAEENGITEEKEE